MFTNDALPINWFFNLNSPKDAMYLAFSFGRHKYPLYQHELSNAIKLQFVTREAFKLVVDKVKQQCEGVANNFIKKLEQHFPKHQVMTTLSMIYPQLWARNPTHADEEFHQ
jgi:hypothetical protein